MVKTTRTAGLPGHPLFPGKFALLLLHPLFIRYLGEWQHLPGERMQKTRSQSYSASSSDHDALVFRQHSEQESWRLGVDSDNLDSFQTPFKLLYCSSGAVDSKLETMKDRYTSELAGMNYRLDGVASKLDGVSSEVRAIKATVEMRYLRNLISSLRRRRMRRRRRRRKCNCTSNLHSFCTRLSPWERTESHIDTVILVFPGFRLTRFDVEAWDMSSDYSLETFLRHKL
ncbi:hypothetical protein C8R46DRAFT_1354596 [Mycena filopes]|nr:hypothetical protein C8R46DRAFT_1354596 [Mycena filopes]